MGQGQEEIAEGAMKVASREGHWVCIQNIHLVKTWLPTLEKKIEEQAEGAHDNYRLYLSADPATNPANHIIPQTILETSIKITNEPPSGIFANLHKALDNFTQETLETSSKEAEYKSILFFFPLLMSDVLCKPYSPGSGPNFTGADFFLFLNLGHQKNENN